MGLFKQLMIFGKTGLQGLSHAGDSFSLGLSRQGATGVPLFTTWDSVASSGRAPIPGNISGRSRPTQVLNSVIAVLLRQEPATWGGLDLGSAGVWDRDYGPGMPPFWRTREELCTVRDSAR
jgi:hypothetical protein